MGGDRHRGGHDCRRSAHGRVSPDLVGPPAEWMPVPLAALAMFVVGVLDDRLQLSPVAKLVSSLAIGAFLVFALAGVGPRGRAAVRSTRWSPSSGSPASATR